jgi:phosphate transport system substrate-binding protein
MKRILIGSLALALLLGAANLGFAADLTGQIIVAGSTSVQPLSEELAQEYMSKHPGVRINVQGGGSGAGITAAKTGAAQIGASSRELKPEEETDLKVFEIAKDGIAIVVHPSNKLSNLTTEQVRKIFSGEITNWKDVGGKNAKIMLVIREAGSGTRGAFEELVMGKTPVLASAIVQGSTGAVMASVAQAKEAIGYMSMGAVDKTVKAVKVDGAAATEENVVKKLYKIQRPFLYLTKGEPTGLTKAFIDYVLGKEGQKLVARDYIPVNR